MTCEHLCCKTQNNWIKLYFVGSSKELLFLGPPITFPDTVKAYIGDPDWEFTWQQRFNAEGCSSSQRRLLTTDPPLFLLYEDIHLVVWPKVTGTICVKPTSPAPFSPAGHRAAARARCRVSGCVKPSSPAPFNTCHRSAETSATETPARWHQVVNTGESPARPVEPLLDLRCKLKSQNLRHRCSSFASGISVRKSWFAERIEFKWISRSCNIPSVKFSFTRKKIAKNREKSLSNGFVKRKNDTHDKVCLSPRDSRKFRALKKPLQPPRGSRERQRDVNKRRAPESRSLATGTVYHFQEFLESHRRLRADLLSESTKTVLVSLSLRLRISSAVTCKFEK